jgi:hypothetical protein
MIQDHLAALKNEFPRVEIARCPAGGFPRTRIVEIDAQRDLIARIAISICQRGMERFPIARQGKAFIDAILIYITEWELDKQEVHAVKTDSAGFWGETTREILLLLRGILAGGILSFAFG